MQSNHWETDMENDIIPLELCLFVYVHTTTTYYYNIWGASNTRYKLEWNYLHLSEANISHNINNMSVFTIILVLTVIIVNIITMFIPWYKLNGLTF